MAQETQTPVAVITAATRPAKGKLDVLILLGTFGAEASPRAMIRTSKGEVVTLKIGDRLGRDPVMAIEDGRIALMKKGRTHWLTQPVAQ